MSIALKHIERLKRGERPPFHCCQCCGRELKHTIAWLHLSTKTGKYTQAYLPESESQGWFPFGPACAEKILTTR